MFENKLKQADDLKQKIDNYRPLNQDYLNQIKEYYKIGLTYSSNALEGNTLTETETKIVIEDGITVAGKPLKDHFEAVGHSEAYDWIFGLVKNDSISEADIKELHRLFYYRIDRNNAGIYRDKNIIITGAAIKFPSPKEISAKMQKFCKKIPEYRQKFHPIEFAAILHIELVNIHPFIDGNGRTARLLMNLALLQEGYNITIIPPVLRPDYIDALKASNKGNNQPFINFISEMVYESQKDYLRILASLSQ